MIQHLYDKFQTIFQAKQNPRAFFAPGRINLIGEHTDYNGGHVFPASISFGTYALGHKRTDRRLRFYSMNFPDRKSTRLNSSHVAISYAVFCLKKKTNSIT